MNRMLVICLCVLANPAFAESLRVPQDHARIQDAVDAAKSGDTVLVAAGVYFERIQMKSGVRLRSAGDDTRGKAGLKRAEATILNGGGNNGTRPGVRMAEGSVLDGFTLTNIGVYDDAFWRKHHASQGEELDDDEGSVQAEGTTPAIQIREVNCLVVNNIVHHNGDVGIAVIGSKTRRITPQIVANHCYRNLGGGIGVADLATPIVRDNHCWENLRAGIGCRNADPLIIDNRCYKNIRAGIGCREGARPIIRGNRCFENRRAGIGIRMPQTAPLVEDNDCYENAMAGIGNRDQAAPIIRGNRCYANRMAGIGSDGSTPLIVENHCRENLMAGIGLRGGARAIIHNNTCHENKLVAIGVTQGSHATILGNHLGRTAGVPPIIAVKDNSTATIQSNRIRGGGVAAILVQGSASIRANHLTGVGEKQGNAVWVWPDSKATIAANTFDGYRSAVNAAQSSLTITDNQIEGFSKVAIVVKDSTEPAHVYGNIAVSSDPKAEVVQVDGKRGVIEHNRVQAAGVDAR